MVVVAYVAVGLLFLPLAPGFHLLFEKLVQPGVCRRRGKGGLLRLIDCTSESKVLFDAVEQKCMTDFIQGIIVILVGKT